MKIILAFFFTLLAGGAVGQARIMTRDEAENKKFHPDMQPVSYSTEGDAISVQRLQFFLKESLGTVISEQADPGIGVFAQVFVNAGGGIDYLIFDAEQIKGYDKDSLNKIIKEKFVAVTNSWQLSVAPEKPFQLATFNFFGKKLAYRKVRHTDSSVVDVPYAQAFADSLKVKRIFFNDLELTNVPEVIYRFPNTEELYLNSNRLVDVNIDFSRFPKLKQLHLQNNEITNDGLILSQNNSLNTLNLRDNKLTDIPIAVRNCKELSSLWLGGNSLSALSNRSFRKLKQIKDLNFYKSGLAVLPKGIRKMKNLEVLDLYYNQFEKLPNSLTKLKKLTHLAISYNQLKTLPPKMNRLKNVHTLYAHHNRLSALPESVSRMNKVNILDLGFNWFTNFPAEVASLKGLKELDISSNNFAAFPEKLLDIKELDKVYLQGNPFVSEDINTRYKRQLGVLKEKKVEVFY
ncbi:Leucine rich repeat-containing protein [Dyadobacter koreensis]|uniref:Leucine rich repeat-containing protein n=1 Tax=Dyadobacter koreensis TaxID=408657 RepID=A0A1H6TK96_9BACT|nr:leucine-rich repeat domain-containing protein [Dyadobacter koreensis]SEI76182.1 Leucine rich repeat-containing protein [Dyadobacter koreensis]